MRSKGWLVLLLSMAGCTLGPHYTPPYVDNPEYWRVSLEDVRGSINADWWYQFDDDVLVQLIGNSLEGNQDLIAAKYRVEEFLGLYRVTRSNLYPQIGGSAEYSRQKLSLGPAPLLPGMKNPNDLYQLMLNGSWEIDVWGKLRRATEAACRDLLAAEENRLVVVQTLVSSVALAYINLLRLDRQLEIAIETAKSRGKTLELFQKRFAAGVISEIDLSQIESQYREALATIPDFEQRIERQENAISVLLGRNPGPIPRGKTLHTLTLPEIPSEIPSHLLLQRPDLRAAEQELAAATARIAVARAAYFPSISLTGAYGTSSNELSSLFTAGTSLWNYGVPITMPIFTAGRISGEVKAAEAFRNQLLATYRQRILEAFQDVNDSLIVFQKRREQEEEQRKQVESLQVYARLARLRYDEGYASYLEVLDAERSLFNVQLEYSEVYANLFQALVALYRSLGGGWIYVADPLTECFPEEIENHLP
ncbi:efflux transporter outer membrane subunit [Waddlia chondrophila]|nr:efflux transporter outer membrane subunit [Waddlia chondrophila]ADI39165.1 putative outer membrane efflux protein [Waddlia chondrophila WSU 86-1044]